MRSRRSCAGNFGSAQPTEESGSAPGRGSGSPTPTGHTRPSPFRKLRYRLIGATSTSGSGPTRSRERLPLLIWNSPVPAAGCPFGKAASRPVKPAGGSASRFAPPPHHPPGFRKGPLRREKRASESGPFRRSRKRPNSGTFTAASPSFPGNVSGGSGPANGEPTERTNRRNPPPGRAGPGPGLLREARLWPFVRPVVFFG